MLQCVHNEHLLLVDQAAHSSAQFSFFFFKPRCFIKSFALSALYMFHVVVVCCFDLRAVVTSRGDLGVMFDESNPPSPNRAASVMSPLMKDAVKDVDWSTPLPLPSPSKPDPRESPWLALSAIVPGLFLTCERTTEDRLRLVVLGCRLVIRMNAEVDEAPYNIFVYDEDTCSHVMRPVDEETFVGRLVAECSALDSERALTMEPLFIRSVVADDSPVFDIAAYFEELCSLMELVLSRRMLLAQEYHAAIQAGGDIRLPNIVVHCKAGVSRSAAIVVAYLMKRYHLSKSQAIQYVQDARPVASPNHGFVAQLTLWESTRGHRVTDDSSAALVAENIVRNSTPLQVASLLTDQLRVLSTSARLTADREVFGRLVGQLVERHISAASIVHCLDKVVIEGIEDQTYIDSPLFLQNIVQITTSVKTYAPAVVATEAWAVGEDEKDEDGVDASQDEDALEGPTPGEGLESRDEPVVVGPTRPWVAEDAIHRRWIKAFTDTATDATELTEAVCKFLYALGNTQVPAGVRGCVSSTDGLTMDGSFIGKQSGEAESPSSSWSVAPSCSSPRPVLFRAPAPSTINPESLGSPSPLDTPWGVSSPPAARITDQLPMCLSFPFMPALAQFAVGFIPWAQLDEVVPSCVDSISAAQEVMRSLRALSRRWFLVARWDGAVGAVGMKDLVRWSSCTADPNAPPYLSSIKDDIEVEVFEAMEKVENAYLRGGQQTESSFLGDIANDVVRPAWARCQSVLMDASKVAPCTRSMLEAILREKITAAVGSFIDMQRSELDYVQRTMTLLPDHHNLGASTGSAAGIRRSVSAEGSSLSDAAGAVPPPIQLTSGTGGAGGGGGSPRMSVSGCELDDVKLLGRGSWHLWLQESRQQILQHLAAELQQPSP